MQADEAIAKAKEYARQIFANEGAINLGLEVLRFDDTRAIWEVTVGFTRSWDRPSVLARFGADGTPLPRTFKTIEIQDSDGRVLGVKHWPVAA